MQLLPLPAVQAKQWLPVVMGWPSRSAGAMSHRYRVGMPAHPFGDAEEDLPIHHLGPPGGGLDVAMAAGLVAASAEIDLERLEGSATQVESVAVQRRREGRCPIGHLTHRFLLRNRGKGPW